MECYESFKQAKGRHKNILEQSLPETLERDEQAKLWADGGKQPCLERKIEKKQGNRKSNRGK